MSWPRDYYTKWHQKQISYDIIYIWNKKNYTNELIYKTGKLTDFENKMMVIKEKR